MKLFTLGIILVTSNVALAKNFTLKYEGKVVKKEFCKKNIPTCNTYRVDEHLNECTITVKIIAPDQHGIRTSRAGRVGPISWSVESPRFFNASIQIPGVTDAIGLQNFPQEDSFTYTPPRRQNTLNAAYIWRPQGAYAYIGERTNPVEIHYNDSDNPEHMDYPINIDHFYLYFYGSVGSGYRFKCDNLKRID